MASGAMLSFFILLQSLVLMRKNRSKRKAKQKAAVKTAEEKPSGAGGGTA